ncbi:MAG: type I restriction enzyme HsdR N-terminal domain-containing protein [Candidatus Marinimicrobia bacterium]|nr:type I restriction enzyme HsdR N-terminal domain-containing protein [Candidatus Neomarinimicrobiota bacterium]
MNAIIKCIEKLRIKLDKHRKDDLKEYPTRTIFIDPLLQVLGWDVRDPEDVELEYPTIDGKSVDYAPKINRKPVLFIEAKPLNNPLTDVKSITQVVGYSANAGIEWCILTNGVTYKVYRSTEKAEAPDKLLFEISLDPKETEGMSIQQVAEQFARFSRDAMAKGLLDEIGEQVFTTGKIRKALDKLLMEPPNTLIRLIRSMIGDDTIKPMQVKKALKRLWSQTSEFEITSTYEFGIEHIPPDRKKVRSKEYNEEHHIRGKPQEVVELFRIIDKFCREFDPTAVQRKYLAMYVRYTHGKNIFCCVHLQKSGLRVWLKLNYSDLENPPEYVRDVSNVGHWGVGDIELAIDSFERFQNVKYLIQKSLEKNKRIK